MLVSSMYSTTRSLPLPSSSHVFLALPGTTVSDSTLTPSQKYRLASVVIQGFFGGSFRKSGKGMSSTIGEANSVCFPASAALAPCVAVT